MTNHRKLKPEYYQMIISNNFLFADIIKIFNKDAGTMKRWAREKRIDLNNYEVLKTINFYLKKEKRGVENLEELFEINRNE